MVDDIVPRSILLAVLLLAGGFFAASETSLSFCNQIRMRKLAEEGNRRARKVVAILDDFDYTLATLLIAINVIYISASSMATVLFVDLLGDSGSLVSTVVMTLLVFLFSETIPKNIARANSDAFAMRIAGVMFLLKWILTPLAAFFTQIGALAKKLLRHTDHQPSVTEDEFTTIVESAEEDGYIEPEETSIIKSAIEFGNRTVQEVMTPRAKVIGISIDASPDEIQRILIEEKYSRFPIYKGSIDHIVGVLQSVNSLLALTNGHALTLRESMTNPYIVRPELPLDAVFEGMCGRRTHFAVVVDQGRTLGVVTMEDILEDIVGEIYDEDDVEPAAHEKVVPA